MSRCFPFPPPGYEKKAKIDDLDLLKKEKHKEKRRKKEEKDKQKEGRDKKDKERSKEKNREKKDRKEKPNDNKDRDKEKGKIRISDDKKTNGSQPELDIGENSGPNDLHTAGTSQDSKFVLELDRRIKDGDRAIGSQMVQKTMVTDQRMCELPKRDVESIPTGGAGDRERFNSHTVQRIMVRDQRTSDLPRTAAGSIPAAVAGDREKVNRDLPKRVAESIPAGEFGDKEKIDSKREDDRKINGLRTKDEREGPENSLVRNHFSMGSRRVEGTSKPMETKSVEKQMVVKEKIVSKGYAFKGDKPKEKDGVEKGKSKDGDSGKSKEEKAKLKEEKAKRKEEKAKRKEEKAKKKQEKARKKEEKAKKIQELNHQQPKPEENGEDSIVDCSNKPFHLLKEKDATAGKVPVKRKEPETNGVLHDADIRPNKVPRTISTANTVLENGRRKQDVAQTAMKLQPDWQKAENAVDIKEKRINGLITAPQTIVSSTRPPPAPTLADANGNLSRKPPHPDSKYLDEILSVPKLEVLDFDDQEWLFGSENRQSKTMAEENDGIPELWAEALRIESSDITALPYVIPY